MAATAGGTPARRSTTKGTRAKGAAPRQRPQVPHPPPPLEETFRRGPGGNGTQPDTEADVVMLPGGFSFEPIRFDNDDAVPEEIRVPLFYGPDGTKYTVWANPPPNVGLTLLREFGTRGGDEAADVVATTRLMTAMLGEDGYAALLRIRTLDVKRYAQINAIVRRIAMGPLEPPKDAGSD